ncbi:MAG: hypothetical protein IT294_11595 [Deltaproteobacteria bacterium]|nr:hypothetical protein [Deltaproteobacteria bacterium]
MHALYVFSVWVHVLAAITWIGGMFFLMIMVMPWLRQGDRATAAAFLRETGTRFRTVGWGGFGVLLVTGAFNALVLVVSSIHDFVVGPRVSRAVELAPRSALTEKLRRRASLLGRANAVLALVLVALGVILVRGWPI